MVQVSSCTRGGSLLLGVILQLIGCADDPRAERSILHQHQHLAWRCVSFSPALLSVLNIVVTNLMIMVGTEVLPSA